MELLPLPDDPFTAPTDSDMLPSERREFVRTHRTCVFGDTAPGRRPGDVDRVLHPHRHR